MRRIIFALVLTLVTVAGSSLVFKMRHASALIEQETAATRKAVFIKKMSIPGEPVELVRINVEGKPVNLSNQFEASEDWFETVEITVRNTSGKTITLVEMSLEFPTKDSARAYVSSRFRTSKPLASNQAVSLRGQRFKPLLDEARARGKSVDLSRPELWMLRVAFDDTTEWMQGIILERDPKTKKSKKIGTTIPPRTDLTSGRNGYIQKASFAQYCSEPGDGMACNDPTGNCQHFYYSRPAPEVGYGRFSGREVMYSCECNSPYPIECGESECPTVTINETRFDFFC